MDFPIKEVRQARVVKVKRKRRLKVKMASPRKRRTTVAPQWEVKAKRDLAIWKQHLPIAKAIAQSDVIVRCATQKGLAINHLKDHNFSQLLESPVYGDVRREAEAEVGGQH